METHDRTLPISNPMSMLEQWLRLLFLWMKHQEDASTALAANKVAFTHHTFDEPVFYDSCGRVLFSNIGL